MAKGMFTVVDLVAGAAFRSGTVKEGIVVIILGQSKTEENFINVCIVNEYGCECLRVSREQTVNILNTQGYEILDVEAEYEVQAAQRQAQMVEFDAAIAQLMAELGSAGTESIAHEHDENCGCEQKSARREIVRD